MSLAVGDLVRVALNGECPHCDPVEHRWKFHEPRNGRLGCVVDTDAPQCRDVRHPYHVRYEVPIRIRIPAFGEFGEQVSLGSFYAESEIRKVER